MKSTKITEATSTKNECPFCHETLANRKSIRDHLNKERCAVAKATPVEEKKEILAKFHAVGKMIWNDKVAESEKEFVCGVCKKVFSTKWLLNKHMKDAPYCKKGQKRDSSFLDDLLDPPAKQKLFSINESDAPDTHTEDVIMLSEVPVIVSDASDDIPLIRVFKEHDVIGDSDLIRRHPPPERDRDDDCDTDQEEAARSQTAALVLLEKSLKEAIDTGAAATNQTKFSCAPANVCGEASKTLGNMRYSWTIIEPPTKGALRNCTDIPKLLRRRRNVSFFCVVADCDIPKYKLERTGLDEYVKSRKKRGFVLSTEVSRFRTKLTALVSGKGEMQIHIFMEDLSKLPPAFQGSKDGLAIFAIFGGRKASMRSGKGHRWSVNDSGGWQLFSLTGEIICGAGTCYEYSTELRKFLRRLALPAGTSSLSSDSISPACTTEECEPWVNYSVNDAQKELTERLAQATDDQRRIYMALTKEIDSRAGPYRIPETSSLHMILGGAGTGKTSLLRLLLAYMKAKCIPALPVAATKMAATLLSGGKTVHSAFGIHWRRKKRLTKKEKEEKKEEKSFVEKEDQPKCDTSPGMAGAVAGLRVLIWDEISCSSKLVVDAVSKEFQLYHNNTLPFGGVVTIFCGDFYQLLPVVGEGQDDRKIALPEWAYWDSIQKHQLTANLRAADPIYAKVLEAQKSSKEIVLPQQIMVEKPEELIDFVFPRFKQDYLSNGFFTGRAILCPCRWQAREINARMMDALPGEKEVLAEVTIKPKPPPPSKEPTENVFAPSSAPPMQGKVIRLYVKTGCLLLCTKNISDKIYNGTRLVYLRREGDGAVFRVINGDAEEEVTLAKSQLVWHGCIPFTLGFALTIHKAQGQTLRTVGLDLRSKFFAHGQATVAFSRTRHMKDIRVLSESNTIDNPIYLDWLKKIYSSANNCLC